jgi:hypothetical protein
MNAVVKDSLALLKLDIGSGPKPREGYVGLDILDFGNTEITKCDLGSERWPFDDNSVGESHSAHFLEHLTNLNGKWERVHFFNELWRVTVPVEYNRAGLPVAGFCKIIMPHWSSNRYYGDPTHKEPFGEMGICYLDPMWRKQNAPHTDSEFAPHMYNCHWAVSYDYTLHPDMAGRNEHYVRHAVTFWKEAAQDLVLTMACIKK